MLLCLLSVATAQTTAVGDPSMWEPASLADGGAGLYFGSAVHVTDVGARETAWLSVRGVVPFPGASMEMALEGRALVDQPPLTAEDALGTPKLDSGWDVDLSAHRLFSPGSVAFLSVGAAIGVGGLASLEFDEAELYAFAQPELRAGVRVHPNVRLVGAVGFRVPTFVNAPELADLALMGPTGSLGVEFGRAAFSRTRSIADAQRSVVEANKKLEKASTEEEVAQAEAELEKAYAKLREARRAAK